MSLAILNRAHEMKEAIVDLLRDAEVADVYPENTGNVPAGTKLIPEGGDDGLGGVVIATKLFPESEAQLKNMAKDVGSNSTGAIYITKPNRGFGEKSGGLYKPVDTFIAFVFSKSVDSSNAHDVEVLNQSIVDILLTSGAGYILKSDTVVPIVKHEGFHLGQVVFTKMTHYPNERLKTIINEV